MSKCAILQLGCILVFADDRNVTKYITCELVAPAEQKVVKRKQKCQPLEILSQHFPSWAASRPHAMQTTPSNCHCTGD